jgi:hypothetical protein
MANDPIDLEADLADALEPSQLTAATGVPLPRKKLGRATVVLLVALRIYIFVAVPIVAYAFIRALSAR